MTQKQSIRQNITWLAAVNLVSKPLWFVFLLYSARALGPGEFGKYMLSISFISVIIGFLEGGIDIHTIRAISSDPSRFHFLVSRTIWIKIVSGIAAGGIGFGLGIAVPSFMPDKGLFFAMVIYALANTLLTHLRFVFRAFEIMQYEAISIIAEKISIIFLCSIALLFAPYAFEFGVLFAAAYAITGGITFWLMFRHIGNPGIPRGWRMVIQDIIRPALPFATMNVFIILYLRSGTLLLSIMTGNDVWVGYFNAGYRIVEAFVLFPSMIIAPLYPVFSRRMSDTAEVGRLASDAIRVILAIAVVISVPIFLFREHITILLYGSQFSEAALPVGIVGLAMIPIGLNWVVGTLVAVSGRQRAANYFIFFISLGNILLLFMLIPHLGVAGAAVSVFITECAIVASNWFLVRDFIALRVIGAIAAKMLIPIAVATIPMLASSLVDWHLLLGVVIVLLGAGFFVVHLLEFKDLKTIFRERISSV